MFIVPSLFEPNQRILGLDAAPLSQDHPEVSLFPNPLVFLCVKICDPPLNSIFLRTHVSVHRKESSGGRAKVPEPQSHSGTGFTAKQYCLSAHF